jgi:hypothetical protein
VVSANLSRSLEIQPAIRTATTSIRLMTRFIALVVAAELALPGALWAQTAQPPTTQQTPPVDASRMGVSFDRIRRELAQAEAADAAPDDNRLKFSFTVEVVGSAPKIDLLQGFSLRGGVPYGSPTHNEVLDVITPRYFRTGSVPFSAIAFWAAQQLAEKSKKTRCEEELAEYKKLVMAGVSVAAPRCTQ